MWGDIAIAFLLAFIAAYVITPYTIRFAKKIGAACGKELVNESEISRVVLLE